jgi:hypothetical protein
LRYYWGGRGQALARRRIRGLSREAFIEHHRRA